MGQIQKTLARSEHQSHDLRGLLGILFYLSTYVQMTIVLALFTMIALTIGKDGSAAYEYWPFFANLLIVIPVISTQITEKKCKHLGSFMLINAVSIAVMLLIYQPKWAGVNEQNQVVVPILMFLEAFFLLLDGFRRRLQAAEQKANFQTETSIEQLMQRCIILQPGKVMCGLILAGYLYGVAFHYRYIANTALATLVVYYICAKYYIWYEEVHSYISIHKRVQNRPDKRIIRVSGTMLLVSLVVVSLFAMLSFASSAKRPYLNLDKMEWKALSYLDIDWDFATGEQEELPKFDDEGELRGPTMFDKAVFAVIAVICLAGIAFGVFQMIRSIFRDFREGIDENGDIVEDLKNSEDQDGVSQIPFFRRRMPKPQNERERIRYEFVRMIRKHRKDQPYKSETPMEMEEAAGLLEDARMQALHTDYEWARYSEEEPM